MSSAPVKILLPAGAPGKLFVPSGAKAKILSPQLCETCQIGAPNLFPDPTNFTGRSEVGTVSVVADVTESPGCIIDADQLSVADSASTMWWEAAGFVSDALLDVSVWCKFVSINTGTDMRIYNTGDTADGLWIVDITYPTLVDWQLLTPSHPAVTVVNPMKVRSNTRISVGFSCDTGSTNIVVYLWCMDIRYQ